MIGRSHELGGITSVGWRLLGASVAMHRVDDLPHALPYCPALVLSGGSGGAIPLRGQQGASERGGWCDE